MNPPIDSVFYKEIHVDPNSLLIHREDGPAIVILDKKNPDIFVIKGRNVN